MALRCLMAFRKSQSFRGLQERRPDAAELGTTRRQVVNQRIETTAVDTRLALESLQDAELVIQLLLEVTADITTRQYSQDFKKRRDACPCRPVSFPLAVVKHLLVQEFEAQERTHTLR